jgi:hypothetical protein
MRSRSKKKKKKKKRRRPGKVFLSSLLLRILLSLPDSTHLSSIFWIFERSSMAASESSEEGAGVDVGGEADARRRGRTGAEARRRRCINDVDDVGDSGDGSAAALVDASAAERPPAAAAIALTRMTACGGASSALELRKQKLFLDEGLREFCFFFHLFVFAL